MAFIPPDKLENLSKHKYNSTGYSYLDLFLNKIIWEPLVTLFPRNLAPNLITFIGLIFMICSYAIMIPYDTTFTKPIPSFILVISGFCQFMYQTLDACDGKQARKIGLSSPLGMLMDHGCDSLSCTLVLLSLMQGLCLGTSMNMCIMLGSVLTVFYLAMWEEYHTHYSRTHMFSWGVTEGQWTNISLLLLTSFFTASLWQSYVFGYRLEDILVALNSGWGLLVSVLMVLNTLGGTEGMQPYLRLIPLIMLNTSLYLWYQSHLISTYAPVILLVHGFVFAGMCSKIIIYSTAIMKFGWLHLDVALELCFLLEDAYLKILPSEVTFFILSLYILISYFSFTIGVINQLSKHLKLSVFTVNR